MVMARLHVICGNCGAPAENMDFKIDPEGHDVTDEEIEFKPAVFISCNNCATIHDLSTTIKEKEDE